MFILYCFVCCFIIFLVNLVKFRLFFFGDFFLVGSWCYYVINVLLYFFCILSVVMIKVNLLYDSKILLVKK